ncbi:hypothetical protein LHK_01644 [Laribacter hongkongensis HLHK9]|uniref:GpE family phage tail protein n=1 Tax=Laribacter hongkongensis (strain HLHK9) TaxID=557598 RepID=C1D839_LARHH|nr:hypothetical protein [Laribacter hongkongensis]ACO74630.1 hypothetical protein LHK_01644 [Laribacter hongkongensis HLHK9]
MHLIATTGWGPDYIDNMDADELAFWCKQATDYHNHLHACS